MLLVAILFLVLLTIILVLMIIAAGVLANKKRIEAWFLLNPIYMRVDGLTEYNLPSGAIVAQFGASTSPPLLFLKGNAGTLEQMRAVCDDLAQSFCVFAVEYRGYGNTAPGFQPTAESVIVDGQEAWNWLGSTVQPNTIIVGYSLGGGILGELLRAGACPKQAVFVNTFSSLNDAIESVAGHGILGQIGRMLASDWNGVEGVRKYVANCANAKVLVVYTADDALFPSDHADRLLQAAGTQGEAVQLPSGGHTNINTYVSGWIDHLAV
jgi:uncharacterized protein